MPGPGGGLDSMSCPPPQACRAALQLARMEACPSPSQLPGFTVASVRFKPRPWAIEGWRERQRPGLAHLVRGSVHVWRIGRAWLLWGGQLCRGLAWITQLCNAQERSTGTGRDPEWV
jgi:hypothetical protein